MANKDQSPLKGWKYPAGSGIRIREVINRYEGKDYGVSYRVSIPAKLAGKRILKQFADSEAAEKWRRSSIKCLTARGQQHFVELSAAQRDDALKALSVLRESGLTWLR